ncbi:hutH [Lepeophtheirus salmonis]|uniref:Histidine ammonia-lyase n=1 Tax=Lepeophtheirus salmonis TaxID=72036 RepID=A0A0K2TH40_LEPSM|nr:histidine ammonia-lyase-like [Lepeophtheirus salmonis]CAB4058645.1 hutH [Lepeophtheirus salmonis]CAF2836973.1 hutH [Lepeophtheirus salmonis]
MKISCRVRGDWFQVHCKDGSDDIRWLGTEALRRYIKLKPPSFIPNREETVHDIRKTVGGAILDPDDQIKDVLDDNDFISIVLETDRNDPKLTQAEIKYVPEQIAGGKLELPDNYLHLDGNSLSTDDLLQLGKGHYKIRLTKESEDKVNDARKMVEDIVKSHQAVYGITTGFGKFASTFIESDKLCELQENLIRSHAAGVGKALTPNKTRMLLALRINVLAKGYSGISLKVLKQLIDAFNASCLPWVPEKGTVGASGDLAPLSHLALGLMGEGQMWSPETGWGEAKYVLETHNLTPIKPQAKEGLALINGTQLITSIGSEALERACIAARQADVVAALTLEVLKGTSRAFDSGVHNLRPHKGQSLVAKRLRSLLHSETYPSEIAQSHRFCNRVQDAYTLRCCPQVHGVVHDTLEFVRGILTTEINSATDNPIVFSERQEIISAGNFHGEYPAKACDYLAIGIHELAAMSERRTERLVNPAYSELPAFLVKEGGLNSGFMIAHCTAAALVSENKTLCHPASVDSLSTSAGTEDHVSMGGFAARKALEVVRNVEKVIAIELLAACQAIEFLRPLKTTIPLEEVIKTVRSVARPWDKDRFMSPDIDAVTKLIREEKIWGAIKTHMDHYNSSQHIETRVYSPTSYTVGPPRLSSAESSGKKRKQGQSDASMLTKNKKK